MFKPEKRCRALFIAPAQASQAWILKDEGHQEPGLRVFDILIEIKSSTVAFGAYYDNEMYLFEFI